MPDTVATQELLDLTMDGQVAVLSMQSPPYNLLDEPMCHQLVSAFAEAERCGARACLMS